MYMYVQMKQNFSLIILQKRNAPVSFIQAMYYIQCCLFSPANYAWCVCKWMSLGRLVMGWTIYRHLDYFLIISSGRRNVFYRTSQRQSVWQLVDYKCLHWVLSPVSHYLLMERAWDPAPCIDFEMFTLLLI